MSARAEPDGALLPRERLDGIDLLRGAACLLVVVYHLGMYVLGAVYVGWDGIAAVLPPWCRWAVALPRMGYLGVSLFLVLSGFCLAWPYVGPRAQVPLAIGPFVRARALRILPPYYASMLLLWAAVSQGGAWARASFQPIEAWDVGVHALLIHNLSARTLWSLNGAYWSLALEAQLYVAFLVVLPAFRRSAAATVLAGLAISALVPLAIARACHTPESGPGWSVVHESMPAHLFELVCGVLAAHVVASRRALPRWPLIVLSLLWFPTGFATTVWHLWPSPLDKILYGISFGALVLLLARVEVRGGRLGYLLRLPGTASYSLYLLHQPVLLVVAPFLWLLHLSPASLWLLCLVVGVPALVLLGFVGHVLFERPFLRGGVFRRARSSTVRRDDKSTNGAAEETSL